MPLPSAASMYSALARRDRSAEGVFFFGVKTTGIFCRPTCASKKPKRENVEFFASPTAALAAGYRACKRCEPIEAARKPPEWVARLVAAVERDPGRRVTDEDLRRLSVEPERARRYFRRTYGMTFQAWHRARRMGAALGELQKGTGVMSVGLQHGFESASGFRDAFAKLFGEPPASGRAARALCASSIATPLGPMVAVAGDALHLLEFADRRALESELDRVRRATGATIVPASNALLAQTERELAAYFDGRLTQFTVNVAPIGTPFQKRAWEALLTIPFAQTRSYSQMAEHVGRVGAQRAIGLANGKNAIAIVIPCHRVVRADGDVCGYGGGVWRKQWLLEHERTVLAR
ncbi:MAG: bifunctional transcriptional activator/DNA repair enzyme AdaA [Planctomycetota bacterium]